MVEVGNYYFYKSNIITLIFLVECFDDKFVCFSRGKRIEIVPVYDRVITECVPLTPLLKVLHGLK
jgi:hypothetical protein